jgi:hypothetical protein
MRTRNEERKRREARSCPNEYGYDSSGELFALGVDAEFVSFSVTGLCHYVDDDWGFVTYTDEDLELSNKISVTINRENRKAVKQILEDLDQACFMNFNCTILMKRDETFICFYVPKSETCSFALIENIIVSIGKRHEVGVLEVDRCN